MQLEVAVLQKGSDNACDSLAYLFVVAPADTLPPIGFCATAFG